jgi:hypothetical protein
MAQLLHRALSLSSKEPLSSVRVELVFSHQLNLKLREEERGPAFALHH